MRAGHNRTVAMVVIPLSQRRPAPVPAPPTCRASLSLDKTALQLLTRDWTLVVTTEDTVPRTGDGIVETIADWSREDACDPRGAPRPIKLARHKHGRVAPHEHARLRRSKVGHDIQRVEIVGIPTPALDSGPAKRALQRCVTEDGAAVMLAHEAQKAIAQAAHPVVENEVCALSAWRRGP